VPTAPSRSLTLARQPAVSARARPPRSTPRAGVFTLAAGAGLAALGRRPGEAFTATAAVAGRVFATTYTPERDARGAVAEVLGVALDVTARVRAEARLRAREAQLQALAAHLRADLALATGRGYTDPPPDAPPGTAVPPPAPPKAIPARADPLAEPLTRRERQLLTLVLAGLSSKEIASRLGLKWRTVDKHVENAREKLGVNNRMEAVNRARALGLIAAAPAEPGAG
jgi:DNA-binding NarL/FixJ family response regulator